MCALGVAAAMGGATGWDCRVPMRFLSLIAFCLLGAGLKIKLPGIMGSLPVSYVFVLIGVLEMSLGETLAISACGAVAGGLWNTRFNAQAIQVWFNVATVAG